VPCVEIGSQSRDEALIEAVVRRDIRRAGELHDRLAPVIQATLYRLLGKYERDYEDLVQATFEQIVRSLVRRQFSSHCSLTTWASAVAAHVAFNALRSRRRARRVFDLTAAAETAVQRLKGDAEHDMGIRDQIRTAQAHLGALKPKNAIVLILHDILGHELVEIAAMLDVSIAAAQSRLVRARRDFLRKFDAGDLSRGER
jgi:RNA polymerase sigma-70 factor (ECF subfamily)